MAKTKPNQEVGDLTRSLPQQPIAIPASTQQRPKVSTRTSNTSTLSVLIDSLFISTIAALSSPISQFTISPIYGSIPSSTYNTPALVISTNLGLTLFHEFPRPPRKRIAQWTAIWTFWIPVIEAQLSGHSAALGPTLGPLISAFVGCYSIIIASIYSVAEILDDLGLSQSYGQCYAFALPAAVGSWYIITISAYFTSMLPKLALTSTIFSPTTLQLILATLYATQAPSTLLFYALPPLLHTTYLNPHFDSPTTTALLNSTLLATHNWTLLSRSWSLTGYISVLENQELQYRVLRCDHSLLGGEWLLTPTRQQEEGWTENQSIYSVFEMLEAVRLLDRGVMADTGRDTNALVIGLGIGTAAKALVDHGINTTILELDPLVVHYAEEYFSFPRPSSTSKHAIYIIDAIPFITTAAHDHQAPRYDYIIHDVFTGGAEPLSLFTREFLHKLKSLLKPQGAIAINYAGDLNVALTTRVLNTIDATFAGQCTLYRDHAPENTHASSASSSSSTSSNEHDIDFANFVIFCIKTPQPGPVTFIPPDKDDVAGRKSYSRIQPSLEMSFPMKNSRNRTAALEHHVLRDGEEGLWASQQRESAVRHWRIMRSVVPDGVWELW